MTQTAPPPRPFSMTELRTRAMVGPQIGTRLFIDALTREQVVVFRYPSPNVLGLTRRS